MIAELLERLLTRCPRPVVEMGYLHELIGIRRAFRHRRAAWLPHFERVRKVILAATQRCSQKRKAVILGSGWLNDVPLAELAAEFREVILVDVLHPCATRSQARRWPNVHLLAADVTGSMDALHQAGKTGGPLPTPRPELFLADAELDFTVSVMLLSQLHCVPEEYLRDAGYHASDEIARFSHALTAAHLEHLHRLPGVVTLLTDVEDVVVGTASRQIRSSRLLCGVTLPKEDERWTWTFVPPGRSSLGQGHLREVVAILDLNRG